MEVPFVLQYFRLEIRGVSLLESSLCFVLFCCLLMLAAGLWDYVDISNGITRITDRYAYETNLGAYRYNKELNSYQLDLNKLHAEFNDRLSSQGLRDFKDEVNAINDSQLRLDFAFTTVSVDSESGVVTAINSIKDSDIVSVGGSPIPSFLNDGRKENGEIEFNLAIQEYVNKASNSLAIPTASFGLDNTQEIYLPNVPIIAVRAVYNYQNTGFLKMLGILDEPYGWDIKVAALRAEVG